MWHNLWFSEEIAAAVNIAVSQGVVRLDAETGLLELRSEEAAIETNWLFFGSTIGSRDCYFWHNICFNLFNFVPEFCKLRCWKVVLKFSRIIDLFRFHTFAQALPHYAELLTPLHGKCGIDERFYTDTPYAAFFYCDGKEDALARYRVVRALVDERFPNGTAIPIIVKRSCTEFERKHGPTNTPFWQAVTAEERDLELHLKDIFKTYQFRVYQPDWQVNKTYRRWCKFANTFGDKSWVEYFEGNDFLTTKAVTYHHLKEAKGKTRDAKGRFKSKHKGEHKNGTGKNSNDAG